MHYIYLQHARIIHIILGFRWSFLLPSSHFIFNWRSFARTRWCIHQEESHHVHSICRLWTGISHQMITS